MLSEEGMSYSKDNACISKYQSIWAISINTACSDRRPWSSICIDWKLQQKLWRKYQFCPLIWGRNISSGSIIIYKNNYPLNICYSEQRAKFDREIFYCVGLLHGYLRKQNKEISCLDQISFDSYIWSSKDMEDYKIK